jgi:hypothetical protein
MTQQELRKIHERYGETFILLNRVEFLLEGYIRTKCGFNNLNEKTANNILKRKTFGGKVELAKPSIENEKLKSELSSLVSKRNKLAHSWLTPFEHEGESFFALISDLTVEKIEEKFFVQLIDSCGITIQMIENEK